MRDRGQTGELMGIGRNFLLECMENTETGTFFLLKSKTKIVALKCFLTLRPVPGRKELMQQLYRPAMQHFFHLNEPTTPNEPTLPDSNCRRCLQLNYISSF